MKNITSINWVLCNIKTVYFIFYNKKKKTGCYAAWFLKTECFVLGIFSAEFDSKVSISPVGGVKQGYNIIYI